MFGVILFSVVLLGYGFVLSRQMIANLAGVKEENKEGLNGFAKFMVNFNKFFENEGVLWVLSVVALITGVWNFFAPDFSAIYGPPVIGAFIPSIIMIVNAAVLYPKIIEIINIGQDNKTKYYEIVEKISGLMGIITLVSFFLHIALFREILF
ncbi:MAG: hypothetical protein A2Y33_16690 [Spirochaetes bacterium GWF1_51_8]|nr:MAG: hypothetical protein A2Y33_16690 [Spirochaetes bacterium GWF1_51_8]